MTSISQIWAVLTHSEKRISILLVTFMFTAMIFEIIGLGAFIPLVYVLIGEQSSLNSPIFKDFLSNFTFENKKDSIIFFTASFSFVIFIKNLFLIFSTWFNNKNLQNLSKRVSQQLFKNYIEAPYFFHIKNNSSKLLYNCTDATDVFKEASGHLINLFSEIMVLIGLSFFLFYFEPIGFLISSSIMLFIGFIYFRINKNKLFQLGKKIELSQKEKIKSLMQGLGGIKIIKILKKEKNFMNIFNQHNSENNFYKYLANFITNLPRFILEIIVVIFAAFAMVLLSLRNIPSTEIFLKASVFGFAALRMLPSLNRIISSFEKFRVCKFQINTVYTQINYPFLSEGRESKKNELINLDKFENLSLENIDFKFENSDKYILKNISFKINKGEYIGIVGKTGSGKSTLIDLITGLIQPSSGSVNVNNININRYENWKTKIGYVPQFIYLTDDTLKKNIAFGLDENEIDENQVLKSIDQANLNYFLKNLENGIDEILGERGVKISGGEMQRIGLSRAIYNDPELLIFDEFTSSLDFKTEEEILNNILRYKGEKTIIIISHKLSTLKDCDRVIEVTENKIKENKNYAK